MKKKTLNKRKFVAKKTIKPKEIDDNSRLLNMTDVCLMLNVTRTSIGKYIKEKELPAYKIGKAWYFKKQEIETWLKRFIN
jgi:excisionase family DNA binding protein